MCLQQCVCRDPVGQWCLAVMLQCRCEINVRGRSDQHSSVLSVEGNKYGTWLGLCRLICKAFSTSEGSACTTRNVHHSGGEKGEGRGRRRGRGRVRTDDRARPLGRPPRQLHLTTLAQHWWPGMCCQLCELFIQFPKCSSQMTLLTPLKLLGTVRKILLAMITASSVSSKGAHRAPTLRRQACLY